MDPYIEAPEVWSDFHGRLAEEISATLNEVLQPQYVARLTPRVSYEIVEIGESRSIRPDVGVWQSQSASREPRGGVAVVAAIPVESAVAMELPLRLYTVEVCETDSLRLVTAIEILSPVNNGAAMRHITIICGSDVNSCAATRIWWRSICSVAATVRRWSGPCPPRRTT
jgi:hypothetical protein